MSAISAAYTLESYQMSFKKHLIIAAFSLMAATNALADAGKAYVTSQDGGVSVVDLESMTVTGSIDVKGESPRGLAVTEDGQFLIVATRENGSISIVDTHTNEVVNQIKVGQNPEFVRVKGNLAFVSYEPSAKGGPPPTPGSAEAAAAAKEDDDDDKEPARIGIIDLKLGKKIREITGGPETEGIEFSKDGKLLIITNEADNTITVHNIKTGKRVKTVKTHDYGDRPRGIKVSPDGKTYIATLEYGNKFMVMDKNFKVLRTVDTGATPYGVSFDATGKHIFIAENKAKLLEVFDAKTYEKVKEIPTGNRCWHFSFTPDDKQIMMACGKSDALVLIDAQTLEPTNKLIEIKNMPWGLVTYPKAMGSLDTKLK
jgi:YVTN family beta-propeller protein